MCCTVIQTVDANAGVSASVAIGVVVAQSAFGDIECSIIVAIEIQIVDSVGAVSVYRRQAIGWDICLLYTSPSPRDS